MWYLLALALAVALGVGTAMPVFAAAEDRSFQTQVVGGSPVEDGEYRFMTSLQADTSNRPPEREHFCGGSLIDRNSVLTAAHCVDFIDVVTTPATLSYEDVRIVVGVTVLSSDQGQVRGIERLSDISIHPNYNGTASNAYDVALIELDSPVSINPITPAAVGTDGLERPGHHAKIAGWGNTIQQSPDFEERDNFPNRMREANVPLVSDADCRDAYPNNFVASLMVCAGETGVDTCQGDSGGPMWVSPPGGRRQIGITSFGRGCGARGFPGVYTEVNAPAIRNFIEREASN